MFSKILLGLGFVVIVLAVVISLQPADFRITRSITINAAPPAAFAQVNDFHRWKEWSPWAKIDPEMKEAYEGPAAGKGAIYTWVGNSKVGEGRMTITDSRPHELIQINLEFIKPIAAVNTTEFSFKPEGAGTAVSWVMYGKNNFIAKAMSLVMNMDKMVGPDFEKGLQQLKAVTETGAVR